MDVGNEGSNNNVVNMNKGLREAVLRIQTSNETFPQSDIRNIVSHQILLAANKREKLEKKSSDAKRGEWNHIRQVRKYLEGLSAHEYPPALETFSGLGSEPYRLYQSIAFDKLHALDLGSFRQLPDEAFRLASPDCYSGLSKTEVVAIWNQIMLDVPRAARLGNCTPFRLTAGEKQAGMSGKLRREMLPFVWFCFMGVTQNTDPDEDLLLQVALLWDLVQGELCGVNKRPGSARRTLEEVDKLRSIWFDAGKSTAAVLGGNDSTKLHRVMRYMRNHIVDFGCVRKGATDENETLHKYTKKRIKLQIITCCQSRLNSSVPEQKLRRTAACRLIRTQVF